MTILKNIKLTKIDKRTIMEIVARLRVPIVSKRFGTNSGYSIAKDENEQ